MRSREETEIMAHSAVWGRPAVRVPWLGAVAVALLRMPVTSASAGELIQDDEAALRVVMARQ